MTTRVLLFLIVIGLSSCDFLYPKKKFRLALPKDSKYLHYIVEHLQPLLQSKGYDLALMETNNAFAAAALVTKGEADLCLLNNFSYPVAESLNEKAGKLRTIIPVSLRVFFVFSRQPVSDTITAQQLFTNKSIGLEIRNGEAQEHLERRFQRAHISGVRYVSLDDDPDLIVEWNTMYGEGAEALIKRGWNLVSLDQNWIEFNTKFEAALQPFVLPSLPSVRPLRDTHTYASNVILVGRDELGENAVYELCELLFQHRLELINKDRMYLAIDESFNQTNMLFPLHNGTRAYLLREQPTFIERYADTLALLFSIGAIIYGLVQAIHNRVLKRQKDQVDTYFLKFLDIRLDRNQTIEEQVEKLTNLHHKALEQMTKEKLEKTDFHMLSMLIQQELALYRSRS